MGLSDLLSQTAALSFTTQFLSQYQPLALVLLTIEKYFSLLIGFLLNDFYKELWVNRKYCQSFMDTCWFKNFIFLEDIMSASFKDEDSTQLFENCRKIWKCCDKIFRGGRISDSRVCKLFCTTRRRKREERLSLKTKTAGNSAQNLTDFLIISGFTRNPAHWPSHRVHWTSGAAVDGVETKSNAFRIWTPPSYCFLSLTTDMSPESSLSQKMGPR